MTPIYVLGTAILPRNDLGENTREVRLSTTHPVYGSVTNFAVVEGDITLRRYAEIIESLIQRIEEVAL